MSRVKIIKRSEAKAKGLRHYFTGKPCKRGHVSQRLTCDGACIQCGREISRTPEAKNYKQNYHRKNAKKITARVKRWQEANPDRAWRFRHPQENVAKVTRWRAANPEKRRAQNRNRHARKLGSGGTHTGADLQELFRLQKGKCAHSWCRRSLKKKYHVDHIIALARGGSNDRRNLQLLCPTCNISKHAKHPITVAQQNGMLL